MPCGERSAGGSMKASPTGLLPFSEGSQVHICFCPMLKYLFSLLQLMAPREINKIKALKKLSGKLNVAIVIVTPPKSDPGDYFSALFSKLCFQELVSQRAW